VIPLLCNRSELVISMVGICIGYKVFAKRVACGSRVKRFLCLVFSFIGLKGLE
ncbi:unnamed protein product, partial [Musa textilis]